MKFNEELRVQYGWEFNIQLNLVCELGIEISTLGGIWISTPGDCFDISVTFM